MKRLLLLLVVPTVLTAAPAPKLVRTPDRIPDAYIVILNDDVPANDVPAAAREIAATQGLAPQKIWAHAVHGFSVRMSEARAEALSRHPRVQYVEEDARWYRSAHATFVNPVTCDPTVTQCAAVGDNRLWHLDRLDQNTAAPTESYSYATDGQGVTVYVVDTGVNKFHQEFSPGQVQPGYNATDDRMPADDPCLGFALPPAEPYTSMEELLYAVEVGGNGHGTAVASILGGRRVGVAKNARIVPIKVSRCDYASARARVSDRLYKQHETMWRSDTGSSIAALYRARNSGRSGNPGPPSSAWPTISGATIEDSEVVWEVVPQQAWFPAPNDTTSDLIEGLNWILKPENPNPKAHAVVSLSTYRVATAPGVAGPTNTVESAIRALLQQSITVIASANNQNGNACDTSPARLSLTDGVITVGGSMIVNQPWTVSVADVPGAQVANGNNHGPQPPYMPTQAVRDSRWICGAGDSVICSNITTPSPDPSDIDWYPTYSLGSNAGPCVTLFAPAKNMFVASIAGANSYRDARVRGANSSGTSWSAPVVAGVAARILQVNPGFTPSQVRATLLQNTVSSLDPLTLNTYDHNNVEILGTPNQLLAYGDVNIGTHPASRAAAMTGSTALTVAAGGTAAVSYQWYEVNPNFDYLTYRRGAHSSTLISGATGSTYAVPPAAMRRAYWVRVSNAYGSADSDIAVVVPGPPAPSNLSATASGTSITVSWQVSAGAEKYEVQRKVAGSAWASVARVPGLSLTEVLAPAGGMVAYRVIALAGEQYLAAENLAASAASNVDIANTNPYAALGPQTSIIRAHDLIELRQALNTLCDIAGMPPVYAAADLQLSALQGQTVAALHFTSLLDHMNTARGALGMPSVSYIQAPQIGSAIAVQHVSALRSSLR
jgi:hypothetical protein